MGKAILLLFLLCQFANADVILGNLAIDDATYTVFDASNVIITYGGAPVPPSADLVLEYLMAANGDEANITLDTSVNNNTGTVSGATWSEGTNGFLLGNGSYSYDGGDWIIAPYVSVYGDLTNDFTASFWVNADGDSVTEYPFSQWDSSAGKRQWYISQVGGAWNFTSSANGVGSLPRSMLTTQPIDVGSWHQVIVTLDRGTFEGLFYYDGTVIATQDFTARVWSDLGAHVGIGALRAGSQMYDGDLWNTKLYSTVLTPAQIYATNRAQVVEMGLYPSYLTDSQNSNVVFAMNYSGGTEEDTSTNYATVTATDTASVPLGYTNNAREFNGGTSTENFPDTAMPSGTTARAYSTWFQSDAHASTEFLLEYGTRAGQRGIIIGILNNQIRIQAGGASTAIANWSGDAAWHHLVVGWTNNANCYDALIYVDGKLSSASGAGGDVAVDTLLSGTAYIGTSLFGSTDFSGIMDEWIVFDDMPASNEVFNLHRDSWPLFGQIDNIETNSWWPYVQAFYTFNVSSSDDYSGNGYLGVNTDVAYDGKSAIFNGGTSYIDISPAVLTSLPFSMSSWFLSETNKTQGILSKGLSTANTKYGLDIGSIGDLRLKCRNGMANIGGITSTNIVTDGLWHHAVAVYTATNNRALYLDGILVGVDTNNTVLPDFDMLNIGRQTDSTPGNFMKGLIDMPTTYDAALSSDQVFDIFNRYKNGGQ